MKIRPYEITGVHAIRSVISAIAIFSACLILMAHASTSFASAGYDKIKSDMDRYQLPLTTATGKSSIEGRASLTGNAHVSTETQRNIVLEEKLNVSTSALGKKSTSGIVQGSSAVLVKSMMSQIKEANGAGQRALFITLSDSLKKRVQGVEKDGSQAVDKASTLLKNSFELPVLEAIVLMRNSDIKATGAKVEAQMNAFTQVENLDQILTRYSAFTEALMNGVGPMKGNEPATTRFPFPGVTALKGQAAAQSVKIALADLAIAQRDSITAIRKSFWKRIYIERKYTIMVETLELFKKLHKVADSLYRSGKTSFQDVIKITVKLNLLEDSIVSINETRLNINSEMLALMDLPPDIHVGMPRFSTPSKSVPQLSRLYVMAHENRQELIKIRAMAAKVEMMLKMASTMIMPDLDPGFSNYSDNAVTQVGSAAMKPAFATTISPSTGAGVPIKPWLGTGTPWLEQTRKELLSLHNTLNNSEAQTRKMVRSSWAELDRATRSARLYDDTILALSASALEVSTSEYESGRLSFSEVTGSYSEWLGARLSHAEAIRDIGIARAELQQMTGVSF
ncbi:MAG: TolC family protein [Desulfamplus sp.]|nr:TolC family protein [Desulfamplus sp.]